MRTLGGPGTVSQKGLAELSRATVTRDWQCMLKLASVLVHEAWHFRNGRDEAGAYTAQITFLMHQGSDATAAGVRRARDRVLAVRGSPVEAVAIKLRERQTSPLP